MDPPPPRNVSQRSPSRPSFQAPTKASLARSHPEILEHALSRSPTRTSTGRGSQDDKGKEAEARAFGLRDRKALRPSISLTASPGTSSQQLRQSQSPVSRASRRSSGLAAFAAPPRRVSKRISASDLLFRSPSASQEIRVQESLTNTPEDQLASELGSATGADMIVDMDGPSLHDGFDEPDLPPTPTQLGLEPPPGRRTGLLSSSPSMKHAKWGKRRAMEDLENSPSKLRNVDFGTELEGLTDRAMTMNDGLVPESVIKKRKLKRDLSAELDSLKQDVARLEGFCGKLEQQAEDIEPYLDDLSSLLLSTDPSHAHSTHSNTKDNTISSLISTLLPFSTKRPPKPHRLPSEVNPFALDRNAQADPYLSALAPLKITASSSTVSTLKSGGLVERHQITLSAPQPFPSSLYKVHVSYETNPEAQSLISLSARAEGTSPKYLQQWMDRRLKNSLLNLDVSGLCWGINRYWEGLVSRAQIWAQIEDQHPTLVLGRSTPNDSQQSRKAKNRDPTTPEILTTSDMRRILPQIERASMLFQSKEKSVEALLSCELTIDEWTGEPELEPSICISTSGFDSVSNDKMEQESKKLFQAVLSENSKDQLGTAGGSDAHVIVKATNCVLDALFGTDGGRHKV
ncbi:hypothetical protein BDV18DRAFT_162337 [Aspergillus unguis]